MEAFDTLLPKNIMRLHYNDKLSMVFTNTITVYSGNNMKRVCLNTLCEKMRKIFNVKEGG